MSQTPRKTYGLLAAFSSDRLLLEAAAEAYAAGYRRMEAYTPFAVEGLAAAMGRRRNAVPLICLLGGIVGGVGGYFMQDYATSVSYALNIGGRPFHNIPPFIPITFELTILSAAIFTVVGLMILNGLPRLHHPVFAARDFERVTTDRFCLCIEARDTRYDRRETEAFLARFNPLQITEVFE